MVETEFYQISGFRAHSNGWFAQYDDNPMINAIASNVSKELRPGGRDAPIELVLGILPCGASYVLMTTEQMLTFTHLHRLHIPRGPWKASDFWSLSPIYFHSKQNLADKLKTYKQRPRNKNQREPGKTVDNSTANRGYIRAGSNANHNRAYFEHQRTFYHVISERVSPEKFALSRPYWLRAVRVVSIVFVEWSVDTRRRSERLDDPRLVEVGITDAVFPGFFDTLSGTTLHLKLKDAGVKNGNSKEPNRSEVEEIKKDELPERLRTLLHHDAQKSGVPLILLCHDEEMTRGILSRAGVDTSRYESGLSGLLQPSGYEGSSSKLRQRSLSPRREYNDSDPRRSYSRPVKSEEDDVLSKARQEAVAGLDADAYIVDMQKLARALMELNVEQKTVPITANLLRIQTDTRTCGGDDSLLQLLMWKSMAEGAAIDEQRSIRAATHAPCADLLHPPEAKVNEDLAKADDNDDPNDFDPDDPNDIPIATPTVTRAIDDFSDDDW